MKKRRICHSIHIIATILVLAMIISFTQYLKSQLIEDLMAEKQQDELVLAQTIANTITLEMQRWTSLISRMTELEGIKNPDSQVCNQQLNILFQKYGNEFSNLRRVNSQGVYDCALDPEIIGMSGAQRTLHIKRIIEDPEHNAVLGHLVPPVSTNQSTELVLSFYTPIFDKDNTFLGAFGAMINFSDLTNKNLKNVTILDQGYAFVLDDNGDILFHPRKEFVGKNVWSDEMQIIIERNEPLNEIFNEMTEGKSGIGRYVFEGKDKIAAYAPARILSDRVWGVSITLPTEDLRKLLLTQHIDRATFQFILFSAVVLLVFVTAISLMESFWLFRPIEKLQDTLKKISKGSLDTPLPSVGSMNDELANLTECIESILTNVRQKNVDVQEAVKKRTKALQNKIEELETANKAMVGRELKMIELKKEIEVLKKSQKKQKK